jgi:hypothetical protein
MITINSKNVKTTLSEDGKTKHYSFFACSCKKNDEDYYKKLMDVEFPKDDDENEHLASSYLIYKLSSEDWEITNVATDQWMGIALKNFETKDSMIIQCDLFEYGLLAALKIAEHLNADQQ